MRKEQTQKQNKLVVGIVLKPQGLKGELKIDVLADSPQDFGDCKVVFIDDIPYKILNLRTSGGFVYAFFEGIDDRDKAESLRGLPIMASRRQLPAGRYYIADLVGMQVCLDGQIVGRLKEIVQNGAADVIYVDGAKPFCFPFIEGVVSSVDFEAGTIFVDENSLKRVAVYDED